MLKPFGIASSGSIRLPSGKTPKGYKRETFLEAWNRYLSPEGANQTATPPQASKSATHSLFSTATNGDDVAVVKRREAKRSAACGGVAVENEGARANGHDPGACA